MPLTVTADDFGLFESVNEGIERAHREGILTHASLMVAGAAAADAVRRAHRMPELRVGLHLVVIEGPAVLPPEHIPALADAHGWFPSDQLRLGLRYFFLPQVRRQLAAEIAAQFDAFAATGLTLSHADAHKHMHLHPTVGALLLREGKRHGLARVRVPAEPPAVMRSLGAPQGAGARAMHLWSRVLRRQVRAAGMAAPEAVFGLAWSGHMTEARVSGLLTALPEGDVELYFHPAARRDAALAALMPDYEHTAELAALLSPALRELVAARQGLPAEASARTAASRPAYRPG
jgi:hopanoid biosynthesis associated protein HpnK